ncbi:hypothetical protein AB0J82_20980 [Asanoa sp. NPDC049518]|uniref:hypothetical protein n=1 Tax=unclassified Asanoa TaxID=2685164 RepID=UPI003445986A
MAERTRFADPVPFALAHSAVESHDQVVGVAAWIDRSADLGDPELDAIVDEDGKRHAELVTVERPLWLSDNHGAELSRRALDGLEKVAGLRATLPGKRPGDPDVEILAVDLAAGLSDQVIGPAVLPCPRGDGVLMVLGRNPSVEREPLVGAG